MDNPNEKYYQALLEHRKISRRGLFRSLLKGSLQAQQQSEQAVLKRAVARPPQAVAEPLFLAKCTSCGDCVSACPYGLLSIQEGKASLSIDFCSCDMCQKCTQACTTGALSENIPNHTTLFPQISHLCLKQRQMACDLCLNACPQQALSFDLSTRKISVNQHCNGCGECKTQCPSGYVELVLR